MIARALAYAASVAASGSGGSDYGSFEMWAGVGITLLLTLAPTIVTWGKLTERLNSVQKAQDGMVTKDFVNFALERMKTEMLEKILASNALKRE